MKPLGLIKFLFSTSKIVLRSPKGMQNITKKDISKTNKASKTKPLKVHTY